MGVGTKLTVIIITALAAFGYYRSSTVPEADVSQEQKVMAANIEGPSDAPVQIVKFGDFGCPSCRGWWHTRFLYQW